MSELDDIQAAIGKTEKACEIHHKYGDYERETRRLQDIIDKLKTENAKLKSVVAELQVKNDKLKAKAAMAQKFVGSAISNYAELMTENEKLKAQIDAMHKAGLGPDYTDKVVQELREQLKATKAQRIYYQDIVYYVCRKLGALSRSHDEYVVCGSSAAPTQEVQRRIDKLAKQLKAKDEALEDIRVNVRRDTTSVQWIEQRAEQALKDGIGIGRKNPVKGLEVSLLKMDKQC